MAIPALLVNSRFVAFAGGIVVGAVANSKAGKEVVSTLKDGISGIMEDLQRDYYENKKLVKDIKEGKMK